MTVLATTENFCMVFPLSNSPVFRGTIGTITGGVVTATEERGTYKKWSGDQMDQAVKAIVNNGKSIRRAAMQYNVGNPDGHFLTR